MVGKKSIAEMTESELADARLRAEVEKIQLEVADAKKPTPWIDFIQGRFAFVASATGIVVTFIGLISSAWALKDQLFRHNQINLSEQMVGFVLALSDTSPDKVQKIEQAKGFLQYYGKDAVPILLSQVETSQGASFPVRVTLNSILSDDDEALEFFRDKTTKRLKDIVELQLAKGAQLRNWGAFKNYLTLLNDLEFSSRQKELLQPLLEATTVIESQLCTEQGKEPNENTKASIESIQKLNSHLGGKSTLCAVQ